MTKETMKRVSKIACSVCGKVDSSPAPSLVTMARQAGSRLRAASDPCVDQGMRRQCFLSVLNTVVDVLFLSFSYQWVSWGNCFFGNQTGIQVVVEATLRIGAARNLLQRQHVSAKPRIGIVRTCVMGQSIKMQV